MHHNGNAKLNPQKVREIMRLRAEGWSYPRLAREFGVSENTIAKTCKGTAWRSVTGGQEVLTDGEAQLRALGYEQGHMQRQQQGDLNASVARLLAAQEKLEAENKKALEIVPEQYRGIESAEEYQRSMLELLETAKHRRETSGPPPEPIAMRQIPAPSTTTPTTMAEQLLETLKDEHAQTQREPNATTSNGEGISQHRSSN